MSKTPRTDAHNSNNERSSIMKTQYTTKEIALEAKLSEAANEEGTVQAGDMQRIAPHNRPELHTTMSLSAAFAAITRKAYDTDFFCA
jgi:hypothetical protein